MRTSVAKGVIACGLALVACALVVSLTGDEYADAVRETDFPSTYRSNAVEAHGKSLKEGTSLAELDPDKTTVAGVSGQTKIRDDVQKALEVASASLSKAKTPEEIAAAKVAVKKALAAAGLADADNAGTIAWANANLDAAKKWADAALQRNAKALGQVAAWKKGEVDEARKIRKSVENAVQAMIAVASATRNKAQILKESQEASKEKIETFDTPIRKAREAVKFAHRSVESAQGALSATLGTQARMAAKHALERGKEAVTDAKKILEAEIGEKSEIEKNRLQSDGARLVGENELHFQCRKTFHRANRVLKLVSEALVLASKNHYAHREATVKQKQKETLEKASKLKAKESKLKEKKRAARDAILEKQRYAAQLAREALHYGQIASDAAKKAAAAGKIAAEKAKESAEIKKQLGGATYHSMAAITTALQRETVAANLAEKAAKMEEAVVTGNPLPEELEEMILTSSELKTAPLEAARDAAADAHVEHKTANRDFQDFVSHRTKWKKHYKKAVHEMKVPANKF